jgi:phosphoribosylformylglycinamidine synthase
MAEAAIVRIKDTDKAIAITTDCNPRFVQLDPHLGTAHAIAEAARNIACTGGLPLAVTDCLNFGSPEAPHVMWQFKEAVDGMGEACLALETPVISGNVSFYNETNGRAVLPTPSVGMVGLLADRSRHAVNCFLEAGRTVVLLGETGESLGGSEYLHGICGHLNGRLPALDLAREKRLITLLQEGIGADLIETARDCSIGGLAVALAKCCFGTDLGAAVDLDEEVSIAAQLFGESATRVVVATNDPDELHQLAARHDMPCRVLGHVGGEELVIRTRGAVIVRERVQDLRAIWKGALEELLA